MPKGVIGMAVALMSGEAGDIAVLEATIRTLARGMLR